MNDYYPPGTPSDFLKEDEPEMIEDFKGNMIDVREEHWDTEFGAVKTEDIRTFVKFLEDEYFEVLEDMVHIQLDNEYGKKGSE